MDVKRKLTYIFWFCLPLLLLLNACDDMETSPSPHRTSQVTRQRRIQPNSMRCAKDCSIRITVR